MKKISSHLILCVFGFFLVVTAMGFGRTHKMDIVQVAMNNDDFTTLVTALSSADLVEELQQAGPYTLFAPTNEAFSNLPGDTLQNLLNNPEEFKKVLLYHVVQGEILSNDIQQGQTQVQTLQGDSLTINKDESSIKINGNAEVTQTDIMADNGVIHVINTVLMPPESQT